MTDNEILLDLLTDFTGTLQWVIQDLPLVALYWQPDAEANTIGVTVWHIGRSFDVLKTRILQNLPHTAEIWHTGGWSTQTGYNPHGIGFAGWGTLARFTRAEVAAIPELTAAELLNYVEQSAAALQSYLATMPTEKLYQPPAGWLAPAESAYQPVTAYHAIRAILMDTREHLGEIKALKAMWERRNIKIRTCH
ncbi:MAG: DinB family protein [Caldilineaceae bacterium]